MTETFKVGSLERYGQLMSAASNNRMIISRLLFENEKLYREADDLLSKHLAGLRVEELNDLENYKKHVLDTINKLCDEAEKRATIETDEYAGALRDLQKELKL